MCEDVKEAVNEEFGKLNLPLIKMENIQLIFPDGIIGLIIDVNLTKSKKDILRMRLQKIASVIQERYSLDGFILTC